MCSVKGCTKASFRNGLCGRHYARAVRRLAKIIDEVRIRGSRYSPTHVKEEVGIFG